MVPTGRGGGTVVVGPMMEDNVNKLRTGGDKFIFRRKLGLPNLRG